MRRSHRIRALLLADIFVRFAFFVMQNYLTDVWKLSFTHAAGILNIWNGISMVLPLFLILLVDALIGNFTMLMISSISYTLGIGLVAMSTPPGYAKLRGTCKRYEPQCVDHTQKALFYTGMSLLAVGISGYNVSLRPFLNEQRGNIPDDGDDGDESARDHDIDWLDVLIVFFVPVIAAIALPYIKSWSLAFGIPAISSFISTSIFLSGWNKYGKVKPRVEDQVPIKTVLAQVEATKISLPITVTMWTTLIVCGIVTSIGNTYFIEQANHMNSKVGSWNVPIEVILLLCGWSREGFSLFADRLRMSLDDKDDTFHTNIAPSAILSVLCCITAAGVEIRRVNVITRHGLLDKPNDDIPMKVGWLYPQFFLLAHMDFGIVMAFASIYKNECSELSMRKYLVYFGNGVLGVGFMCGVLSVYVVGKVSETGGNNRSWFQFTLNKSRLDRYYWVLAVLCSVNLVSLVLAARCCKHEHEEEVVDDTGASADLSSQEG